MGRGAFGVGSLWFFEVSGWRMAGGSHGDLGIFAPLGIFLGVLVLPSWVGGSPLGLAGLPIALVYLVVSALVDVRLQRLVLSA